MRHRTTVLVLADVPARTMGRALGALYTCGASLALVWTLLPHPRDEGDPVVVAMALLALAFGLGMSAGVADRWPRAAFHVAIGVIQVVITVGYAAGGVPANDIRLFYAWATPFAAFFFGPRAALLHGAWTAGCFTVGLVLLPVGPAVAARLLLTTLGTVAAVGALVSVVAARMRASQRELHHAALHDPLTGLPNRRALTETLAAAMAGQAVDGRSVHVMLVDLDHFKLVNDTHGHHVGDQLLGGLAPRLREAVGDDGVVARMGGDEFAVVCEGASAAAVDALGERVTTALTAQVDTSVGPVRSAGSVGVAGGPPAGRSAAELLREADVALYRAKASRRGGAVVFDDSLQASERRRLELDRALHGALERRELSVAYQPVVELATGRWTGAEALLRWRSADLGEVSPAEFVPVAEESDLIRVIGSWVLDRTARQMRSWLDADLLPDGFRVSLNLSGRQVRPGLAEEVVAAMARYRVPASSLTLEVTESVLLDDSQATRASLAELHEAGLGLSLDDFGTGYSSVAHLDRRPLHTIKVDRSLVGGLRSGTGQSGLVQAIVVMARALDLDVVAEGVESADAADLLRLFGCRYAQGYHFARPLSAADLARALGEHRQQAAAGLRTTPAPSS